MTIGLAVNGGFHIEVPIRIPRPVLPIHVSRFMKLRRRIQSIQKASYTPVETASFSAIKQELPNDQLQGNLQTLLKGQWRRLVLGGLAAVFCSVSNVAAPVLTGILFEFLVLGKPLDAYLQVFAILFFSYTVEPILSQFYMRSFIAAGETVLAGLRREVFDRLLHEEVSFFDQHRTSEFTNFLAVELDTLRSFVFSNVTRDRGIRAILEVVGITIVFCSLSWRLAPVLLVVTLSTAISATFYRRSTKGIEEAQFEALSDLVSIADQAISNIRTVRSFGGEPTELKRFDHSITQSLLHGLQFGRAKSVVEALNRGAVHFSLLVLFWYGGALVRQGLLPYRMLVTAIGYVFSIVYASQGMVNSFIDYRKAKTALTRVQSLLSLTHPVPQSYHSLHVEKPPMEENLRNGRVKAKLEALQGDLILSGVKFAYPLRPTITVLNDLNLTLKRGTRTALVGESGSGKSTVSSLLCRFYEVEQGQVLLNGIPAQQFERKEWNSAIALVSQESVLFRGTVFENICYGRPSGATMHDVVEVATSANAHDFIQALPEGYNTVVGEKGVLLSGGERQRIAIARALLKDAPIILLDEATSSLDLRSEAKVQEALNRLMVGRTVMVIAHRLFTIKNADIIAVLNHGTIVERGTHDELISKDGHYAKLVRSKKL